MAESLKKFGRYFLLDLLAQGGMAEIYRARLAAPEGGVRLLAIKRVISTFSGNNEFVNMFRAEIKTTSALTHPNIVQVYDYGEENGMLYIAMELVDGKNLRQFMSRFSEQKTRLPIEASIYIIEQAAQGLFYAHSFKDKFSGNSLNIVHRDVSPQNVLISYDGAVKLIDFGIAKAVTNMESTRSGIIKGKPSYLSPEQISGETLDGRSDIFALGIVLWELLTGKKLFAGENDYNVLKMIENCGVHVKPPSLHNPEVPKELDAIVLKCLHRNREQRFLNADELQRSLHRLLYHHYPEFNPTDVAYYAKELFKNEIVEDRKRLMLLNEKAEELLRNAPLSLKEDNTKSVVSLPEIPKTTPKMTKDVKPKENKGDKSGSFREVEFNKEDSKVKIELTDEIVAKTSSTHGTANQTAFTRARSAVDSNANPVNTKPKKKPLSAVTILALVIGGWFLSQEYNDKALSPRKIAGDKSSENHGGYGTLIVEGNVKAATVRFDDKVVARSLPATLEQTPADKNINLAVTANGYQPYTEEFSLNMGQTKKIVVDLVRLDSSIPPEPEVSTGLIPLRVNVIPVGGYTEITLNGSVVDISGVTQAPLDTDLELLVERDGFKTYRKSFRINASDLGSAKEWSVDVVLEKAQFGFLSIKTTPSADAYILVDGVEEKITTPFSRKQIPVGTYKIRLLNSLLGMEKIIEVQINEDQLTNIEERL